MALCVAAMQKRTIMTRPYASKPHGQWHNLSEELTTHVLDRLAEFMDGLLNDYFDDGYYPSLFLEPQPLFGATAQRSSHDVARQTEFDVELGFIRCRRWVISHMFWTAVLDEYQSDLEKGEDRPIRRLCVKGMVFGDLTAFIRWAHDVCVADPTDWVTIWEMSCS